MANIYDNTALFKRETIESKIENHPMMDNSSGPPELEEGAPKSWI